MSETLIVLSGEPKSTQHIYRYACRGNFPCMYMTAQGKALKEQYQWEAKSQWKQPPLTGTIALRVDLYFGTRRRTDIDNFNKLSLDALTGIIYEDDNQITEVSIAKHFDKAKPRIEIMSHLYLHQELLRNQ